MSAIMFRPSILCPTDFSEPSRGALRFAAAIAEHFYAGLTVATVDDPLLSGAAGLVYGEGTLRRSREELDQFLKDTFQGRRPLIAEIGLHVAIGKPATEILRIVRDRSSDLIVMSTHGRTAMSKLFFGSTTERVLRETSVPVLVTPAACPGPASLEDLKKTTQLVLAPVDLTGASRQQVQIASGLAEALDTPLVLLHVLEPTATPTGHETLWLGAQLARRLKAERALDDLVTLVSPQVQTEIVIAEGQAADEITKLARAHAAGALVMGLHSTSAFGPRMGSVTYRVLCRTIAPVLALPPVSALADVRASQMSRSVMFA